MLIAKFGADFSRYSKKIVSQGKAPITSKTSFKAQVALIECLGIDYLKVCESDTPRAVQRYKFLIANMRTLKYSFKDQMKAAINTASNSLTENDILNRNESAIYCDCLAQFISELIVAAIASVKAIEYITDLSFNLNLGEPQRFQWLIDLMHPYASFIDLIEAINSGTLKLSKV